ncbi:MAG: hypothetical protein V2I33_10575 [Kangiellaceae bacterium]|nr:hypothetical protein [Kangiellaceae bacterium]
MPFKSIFNKITGRSEPAPDQATENNNAEPNKMLSDIGMDKLKSVIAEVTAAFPVFERAGFEIEEVQVEIGMVPKFMPRFRLVNEISVEEQQVLLDEVADKKLVKFMLISLFKSSKMQKLIQDPKLSFHAIEIDLTAVPSVRGVFKTVSNPEKVYRLNPNE